MPTLAKKRVLLYLATFFFWFAQYIYNPFMTPYLLGLGITASFAGTIIGAYGSTQLFCRLPLGLCADRLQKHRIFISLGLAFCVFAALLRAFFPNPIVLLAGNAIAGIASSMWISFTILNSMYYKPEELSKSIGFINVANNAGILAAYIVGGLLYNRFGMNMLFFISAGTGVIGLCFALLIRDEPATANPLTINKLLTVLLQKRLLVFSLLAVVFQLITFATANSFANSVIKDAGISSFGLSVCAALYTLAGMLSAYFVGSKLGNRLGANILLPVGFSLLCLYCILLPHMKNIFGFGLMQFIGGLGGTSVFSLLMALAIADVPKAQRSTAMGFFQSVYSIGIMTGPLVMGYLIDAISRNPAFALIGILCALCAVAAPVLNVQLSKGKKG